MSYKQAGFTLLELAITIVAIVLLLLVIFFMNETA